MFVQWYSIYKIIYIATNTSMIKPQTLALESDPSHISGGAASGLGCVDSEFYDFTYLFQGNTGPPF